MQANKVVRLPIVDSGLKNCIVRLNNSMIDSQKKDHNRFFRREPLIIKNLNNGHSILRYAMGHSSLSISKSAIAIDYDGIDGLAINTKQPQNLVIRRARFWEVWAWFWCHSDLDVRLSIRLGFVGGTLGLLGFVTAIVPLLF